MAISAVVAVEEVADQLVAKLKAAAGKLNIGSGHGKGVDMGPVISRVHRDKIAGYVDQGVAAGAKLVLDGRGLKVPGHDDGFFIGASLFDHVRTDMSIYRDEIFGPVLVVLRVKTLDEAIAMINANPYANGTAVFTRSGGAARRFEREIEVGMVGINVPIPVPIAFYSFGGWRNSLFGDQHVHGPEGVRFYTRGKVVTTRWPDDKALPSGFNMPTLG
jgi:malonate-semialdehyde dehydrogenase (acetylating)/methylmalonate-semialdehyde dehydrogenase